MSQNKYQENFKNTIYRVFNDKDYTFDILVGSEHVLENLGFAHENSWAFITAWNPLPIIYTLEENRFRNELLKKEIDGLGLQYLDGIGMAKDGSWFEESLFIVDISKSQAEDLAKKYNQLAYLFGLRNEKAELVVTGGNIE